MRHLFACKGLQTILEDQSCTCGENICTHYS